jgi:hypothetical protein
MHACSTRVRIKPEIDRIVFANHSRITRVKPKIVRNIESSFIFFIYSLLRTKNMLKSAKNRFFNLYSF